MRGLHKWWYLVFNPFHLLLAEISVKLNKKEKRKKKKGADDSVKPCMFSSSNTCTRIGIDSLHLNLPFTCNAKVYSTCGNKIKKSNSIF